MTWATGGVVVGELAVLDDDRVVAMTMTTAATTSAVVTAMVRRRRTWRDVVLRLGYTGSDVTQDGESGFAGFAYGERCRNDDRNDTHGHREAEI